MHELVELGGVDAQQRLLAGDEALALQVDGDLEGRGGRALAHARLQHIELALLDGELDVHHVAVVLLEDAEDALELLTGGLQAWRVAQVLDGLGVADAGHDVLSLGVHEVVAVELALAGGGVAREGHARGARLALVAKGHGLDVHRGAQVVGDVVLPAVEAGTVAVPGAKDGRHGKRELHAGILRERRDALVTHELGVLLGAHVLGEDLLERGREPLQGCGVKLGVGVYALLGLGLVDGVLEQV